MKKFPMFVFVFAVVMQVIVAEAGQTATSGEVKQDTASRADLQRATREMKRAILSAEQRSAERLAQEQELARKKSEELATQQHQALEKIARDQRVSQERAEAHAKAEMERLAYRNGKLIFLMGLLVIAVVVLVYFMRKHGVQPQKEVETETVVRVEGRSVRLEISNNVDIHVIRTFVNDNPTLKALLMSNGKVEVPAVLVLPYKADSELNGERVNCTIILDSIGELGVRFDERPEVVSAWKNRNREAAKIAKERKQVA